MKKFINDPGDFVSESLEGFAIAHADLVALSQAPAFLRRRKPKAKGVVVLSGGGCGHEPLDLGYVGFGMLDLACPGPVFTAPTPRQIVTAVQSVVREDGALMVVKNYVGDVQSFETARDMLDTPVKLVLVDDDLSGAGLEHQAGRRGVAGTVIVQKIVGAAAELGWSLSDCKAIGDRANERTATMGIALTNCSVPGVCATFEIGDRDAEIGVGLHGEPGRQRVPLRSARQTVLALLEPILDDLRVDAGRPVLLLTNGLGGTPLSELYLLHAMAKEALESRGVEVRRALVGNFATALETAGASLSVTALDADLQRLWDAPVHTSALRW